MENASKALIIAGAILLAILIISLGIMILGKAQDTINGSGMSQSEVQAFNERLTKYEGKQRGSSVRSLIQEAVAANGSDESADLDRKVKVKGVDALSGLSLNETTAQGMSKIKNTTYYYVTFTYKANGYVDEIQISNNQPK